MSRINLHHTQTRQENIQRGDGAVITNLTSDLFICQSCIRHSHPYVKSGLASSPPLRMWKKASLEAADFLFLTKSTADTNVSKSFPSESSILKTCQNSLVGPRAPLSAAAGVRKAMYSHMLPSDPEHLLRTDKNSHQVGAKRYLWVLK